MTSRIHQAVHHSFDFLVLLGILLLGLTTLIFFQHIPEVQLACAILMCAAYTVWGIIHHYHEGNLNKIVVVEYVSIGSLIAFVLVIFLLRT